MENEENKIIFEAELRKDGYLRLRCNGVETIELINVMSEIVCEMVNTIDCQSDKMTEVNNILKGIKVMASMKLVTDNSEEE